tara:strand:+ start:3339 stop:4592 length:1254 start_codon:yes stop_codon:yes gene_type:complete
MRLFMKTTNLISSVTVAVLLGLSVGVQLPATAVSAATTEQAEPEKGPHNGRMLREESFALELAIFETGVPPEFRVWLTDNKEPINPEDVELTVTLTRLGNVIDDIKFTPQSDFLRGNMEIYEPHSFIVTVNANYQGKTYRWQYDNLEGRTKIEPAVADAMAIETAIAGSQELHQTIPAYGQVWLPPSAHRTIFARFEGVITNLNVKLGDKVNKGQVLMTIESNESLKPYDIKSPISGFITQQIANSGEQTNSRELLTIKDINQTIVKLAVYPSDYSKVSLGTPVIIESHDNLPPIAGKVSLIEPEVRSDQARMAWVTLPQHQSERFLEGSFVKASIETASFDVPLAVKKIGLQSFRDFTVVYAKVGDEYEVRMLELGRSNATWVEVLGGLPVGTEYVTENSYIIKADIEKSGASHDH